MSSMDPEARSSDLVLPAVPSPRSANASVASKISKREEGKLPAVDSRRPSNLPPPGSTGAASTSGISAASGKSRDRLPQSPLVPGTYEKQMMKKLDSLHKDGYAKKHTKVKPMCAQAWRHTIPEPAGRHSSQRGSVGANTTHPPLSRSDQQDGRVLRLARHKANHLMMTFEKHMAKHASLQRQRLQQQPQPQQMATATTTQRADPQEQMATTQRTELPSFGNNITHDGGNNGVDGTGGDEETIEVATHEEGISEHAMLATTTDDYYWFEKAVNTLVEARLHFLEAKDEVMVQDLEALLARLQGDRMEDSVEACRSVQDYDGCEKACVEASQFYKVLADLTTLERDLGPQESKRRETDKVRYRKYLHPHHLTTEYALSDGRDSTDAARCLLSSRAFDSAEASVEAAKRCFEWVAADEEKRVVSGELGFGQQTGAATLHDLKLLKASIQVAKAAKSGDELVEKATALLLPYFCRRTEWNAPGASSKDGDSGGAGGVGNEVHDEVHDEDKTAGRGGLGPLGSEKYATAVEALCAAADENFDAANDVAGKEVVRRVRRCAHELWQTDANWFGLTHALSLDRAPATPNFGEGAISLSFDTSSAATVTAATLFCDWSAAHALLHRVRCHLSKAAQGLPFINAQVDIFCSVVGNPLQDAGCMVGRLALLQGTNMCKQAEKCLKEESTLKYAQAGEQNASSAQTALLMRARRCADEALQCFEWALTLKELVLEGQDLGVGAQLAPPSLLPSHPPPGGGGGDGNDASTEEEEAGAAEFEAAELNRRVGALTAPFQNIGGGGGGLAAAAAAAAVSFDQDHGDDDAASADAADDADAEEAVLGAVASGEDLLQRFVVVFPLNAGPRQSLQVLLGSLEAEARLRLSGLHALKAKVEGRWAYEQGKKSVAAFVAVQDTFCAAKAEGRLFGLSKACAVFEAHGFHQEAKQVESLLLCRRGDACFERATTLHDPRHFHPLAVLSRRVETFVTAPLQQSGQGGRGSLGSSIDSSVGGGSPLLQTPTMASTDTTAAMAAADTAATASTKEHVALKFEEARSLFVEASEWYRKGGDQRALMRASCAAAVAEGDRAASKLQAALVAETALSPVSEERALMLAPGGRRGGGSLGGGSNYIEALACVREAKFAFEKALADAEFELNLVGSNASPLWYQKRQPLSSVIRGGGGNVADEEEGDDTNGGGGGGGGVGGTAPPLSLSPAVLVASRKHYDYACCKARYDSVGGSLFSPLELVAGRAAGDGHSLKTESFHLIVKQDLEGAKTKLELARRCFRWTTHAKPDTASARKDGLRGGDESNDARIDDEQGPTTHRRTRQSLPGYVAGDELVMDVEVAMVMSKHFWKGDGHLGSARELIQAVEDGKLDVSGGGAATNTLTTPAEVEGGGRLVDGLEALRVFEDHARLGRQGRVKVLELLFEAKAELSASEKDFKLMLESAEELFAEAMSLVLQAPPSPPPSPRSHQSTTTSLVGRDVGGGGSSGYLRDDSSTAGGTGVGVGFEEVEVEVGERWDDDAASTTYESKLDTPTALANQRACMSSLESSFFDGSRVKETERLIRFLQVDGECDNVQALLRNCLFDDAASVLTRALLVFGNGNRNNNGGAGGGGAGGGGGGGGGTPLGANSNNNDENGGIDDSESFDAKRSHKCVVCLELVEALRRYEDASLSKQYSLAVAELTTASDLASNQLPLLRPLTLVCATPIGLSAPTSLAQSGVGVLGLPADPASVVQERSVASGVADSVAAASALDKGDFDGCREAIARARKSFAWFETAKEQHTTLTRAASATSSKLAEELEQAGDRAAAEVEALAVAVEEAHAEARGNLALSKAFKHLTRAGGVAVVDDWPAHYAGLGSGQGGSSVVLSEEEEEKLRAARVSAEKKKREAAREKRVKDREQRRNVEQVKAEKKAKKDNDSGWDKETWIAAYDAANPMEGAGNSGGSGGGGEEEEEEEDSLLPMRLVTAPMLLEDLLLLPASLGASPQSRVWAAASSRGNQAGKALLSGAFAQSNGGGEGNQKACGKEEETLSLLAEAEKEFNRACGSGGGGGSDGEGGGSCRSVRSASSAHNLKNTGGKAQGVSPLSAELAKSPTDKVLVVQRMRQTMKGVKLVAQARELYKQGGLKDPVTHFTKPVPFDACVAKINEATAHLEKGSVAGADTVDGSDQSLLLPLTQSSPMGVTQLEAAQRFLCRVQGDQTMARYKPLASVRDYDAALAVLQEANRLYARAFPAQPGAIESDARAAAEAASALAEAAAAAALAEKEEEGAGGSAEKKFSPKEKKPSIKEASKKPSPSAAAASPSGVATGAQPAHFVPPLPLFQYFAPSTDGAGTVKALATKDGELFKKRASNALAQDKDAFKAREELAVAETCFAWACVDSSGLIGPLYGAVVALELKLEADLKLEHAFALFKGGEYVTSLSELRQSQDLYSRAGEKKQATDMQAVDRMLLCAQDMALANAFAQDMVKGQFPVALAAVPGVGAHNLGHHHDGGSGGGSGGSVAGGDTAAAAASPPLLSSSSQSSSQASRGVSTLEVCLRAKPVFFALAGLKASGLRKFTSSASQCLEGIEHAIAVLEALGKVDTAMAPLAVATGGHAAKNLSAEVRAVVEAELGNAKSAQATCEASATKANPWHLPLALGTLSTLVSTSDSLYEASGHGMKPAVIVGETVSSADSEDAEEVGE